MALIQKMHGENDTFEKLSDRILAAALHAGQGSERIDVVFDTYTEESIKAAERVNRGSNEGISFSEIRPAHKIMNWRRLLACSQTKEKLVVFLAESWKHETNREKLGNRTLYVTCGEKCLVLTRDRWKFVQALECSHEEADTRMFLHAKHAATHYKTIILVADDTDVLIICLHLSRTIDSQLFIRRGTMVRVRMIDVGKLAAVLGSGFAVHCQGFMHGAGVTL